MTVALTVSVVDMTWHDMIVYWSILNKGLLMATRPRTLKIPRGLLTLPGYTICWRWTHVDSITRSIVVRKLGTL
eukprot:COSAG06_NODE_7399_length_2516_cov_7.278776_4_plen_74_part_00